MTVYGVCTGKDKKTYLCELIRNNGAPNLPVFQATFSDPQPPGSRQDFHVSRYFGSMQVILSGELEIGVSAGDKRTAVGKAGDVFILIDTQGDGHTLARTGNEEYRAVSFRFLDPWTNLSKAYSGWPTDVLPP